jgi:hypothetical protein
MTKNDKASARAVALINQTIDVLLRAGRAPTSPVNEFQRAKQRRELRRLAKRLREGKAEPRDESLHSAEELADIFPGLDRPAVARWQAPAEEAWPTALAPQDREMRTEC